MSSNFHCFIIKVPVLPGICIFFLLCCDIISTFIYIPFFSLSFLAFNVFISIYFLHLFFFVLNFFLLFLHSFILFLCFVSQFPFLLTYSCIPFYSLTVTAHSVIFSAFYLYYLTICFIFHLSYFFTSCLSWCFFLGFLAPSYDSTWY